MPDIRASHPFNLFYRPRWQWYRALVLLGSDILALGGAWQIARYLNQFYSPLPPQVVWWVWLGMPSLFWIFAFVTLVVFASGGLYSASIRSQNYIRTVKLVSLVYLASLVCAYFYDPKLDLPRSLFFTAWFSSIVLVFSLRLLSTLVLGQIIRQKSPVSVFLIASAAKLVKLAQAIEKRSQYTVVGVALATTLNTTTTLNAIIDSQATEVITDDIPDTELASTLFWNLRRLGITLRLLPSSREILYRRGLPEIMAGLPTLRLETSLLVGWDYRLKRVMDVLGALVGLILLSPLFLTVAILIKSVSPSGSVFFRQERIGLQGQVFQMWKFRTMVANAAQLQGQLESQNQSRDGILFKLKDDPRIIPYGNFLRRSSIDELPQLFNVLIGEMSLVGPRPLPLRDVQKFASWHHIRHQVLPGITGLWQISGRSDLEDFNDAARLDLYHIDNWSLNLDLDILIETVRIVLFRKGAY